MVSSMNTKIIPITQLASDTLASPANQQNKQTDSLDYVHVAVETEHDKHQEKNL